MSFRKKIPSFSVGNSSILRANSRCRQCAGLWVYRNGVIFFVARLTFFVRDRYFWKIMINMVLISQFGSVRFSDCEKCTENCANLFCFISVFLYYEKKLFIVFLIINNRYNSLNNWLFHFVFNEKFRNIVEKIYWSDLEVYMPFNLFKTISSHVPIFIGSMSFVFFHCQIIRLLNMNRFLTYLNVMLAFWNFNGRFKIRVDVRILSLLIITNINCSCYISKCLFDIDLILIR